MRIAAILVLILLASVPELSSQTRPQPSTVHRIHKSAEWLLRWVIFTRESTFPTEGYTVLPEKRMSSPMQSSRLQRLNRRSMIPSHSNERDTLQNSTKKLTSTNSTLPNVFRSRSRCDWCSIHVPKHISLRLCRYLDTAARKTRFYGLCGSDWQWTACDDSRYNSSNADLARSPEKSSS